MKLKGKVKAKNNINIASEWDLIAESRAEQLENHLDISMDNVLIPFIVQSMSDATLKNVIDIGCGTGYATSKYREKINKLTGIDISSKSISEAENRCKKFPEFKFINSSMEDFSKSTTEKFSLGIANMTLFIITITHPFFWPFYWGYNNEKWFNYNKEIEIEGSFNISLNTSDYITTHYHRPIEMYINTLIKNGFRIIKISEPLPSEEVQEMYPKKWKFPRFLGILCKKEART
jgi:SAM-dependent methyltransferase